jgi:hypothetical protein
MHEVTLAVIHQFSVVAQFHYLRTFASLPFDNSGIGELTVDVLSYFHGKHAFG